MADAAAAVDRYATHPDPDPEPDAVALAYVHSNDVAYSWHHCVKQLLIHDLTHHRRIYGRPGGGGEIAMRTNAGQITAARNRAVQHLLASDVPWMLWVDTDMGFAPDTLERLLEAADPAERPIVGALCFANRELGSDGMGGYHTLATPTVYDWIPAERTPDALGGFDVRYDYPANQVVRVAGTGAATVLVHRSVYERVALKYGSEWYHRIAARDGSMGEDLSFCMRASALDIPIHVHTGVRTTHAKTMWLSEADFLDRVVAPPATAETAVLVPVLGRPEHAAPFMASLRASTGLATVYAVCDDTDSDARDAWWQAGAQVINGIADPSSDRPGSFAEKVNLAYRKTTEPWLFLVGSDVRFHPGWLDHAQHVAGDRHHVVGTNDLGNPRVMAGEHGTHLLVRRSYVDEVGASWDGPGVVCHEGYRHWHCDDEVVTAAKQRGVWAPALASKVEHLHPYFGKSEMDDTYRLGEQHAEEDRVLFEQRLAKYGNSTSQVGNQAS